MNGYRAAIATFPKELQTALLSLSYREQDAVQEIRLYRGRPVELTVMGKRWYVCAGGGCCCEKERAVICCDTWPAQIVDTACGRSVYAHQEEFCRGFLTTENGCRIGIAGTAVIKNGTIVSFREITSLCVRVAREHQGCAKPLIPFVCGDDGVHSLLICAEPCGGKSSMLKDLLRQLDSRRVAVAVVDERGELAPTAKEIGYDLLLYTPKTVGIEQAVRTLSPQLIVFDELGDEQEIRAVSNCLYRGVPTVATVHCRTPAELLNRSALADALCNGAFEYLCFLHGRDRPGLISTVIKTEDWLREMVGNTAGFIDGYRRGDDRLVSVATPRGDTFPLFGVDRTRVGTYSVFGATAR